MQGSGPSSPLTGTMVDVEAVVVGVFQKHGELGGLFVEEEDPDQDQDAQTSEGLFVLTAWPAQPGDLVRLRGTVTEFKGLTELHRVTRLQVCAHTATLPTPAIAHLPVASARQLEAVESMRVSLPQPLVVTDLHQLWQFGELVVSSKRLVQPTQVVAPGEAAVKVAQLNRQDRLIIDDGRTGRYLRVSVLGQDNAMPFSAANPIRTGQEISGLTGVMHYGFGHYRLQPTQPFQIKSAGNSRTEKPNPIGGTLRVGVFNVLSYFSTLDRSGPVCGPAHKQSCRGARNPLEQQRQLEKLVAAVHAIDADILALVELENNPEQSLRDIINAPNSPTGNSTWSYVATGSIGQDAIKVGLLFKSATVAREGDFAILNRAVDARYNDALNRPALAQSFRIQGSGELLTIVVTHLKSKVCSHAIGPDADQGDGQGCYNRSRTGAAAALADWVQSDPTGNGSELILVLGDFNSYRMEDPIQLMRKRNLIDLLDRFDDAVAWSYVYDGLIGTLDYAFSSQKLLPHVTGITAWHINADESTALDYRDEAGKPKAYYAASPFRSSDHDPLIIGLDLGSAPATTHKITSENGSSTRGYTLLAAALLLLILGTQVLRKQRAATIGKPNPHR